MGFLGAFIPFVLVDITGTEEYKVYTVSSMLGNLAGLGLGHNLLQNKDFTTGQGNLIRLSGLAGGLIGLGTAYLITDDDDATIYLVSSSVGATTGFWLMYRTFDHKTRTSENNSSWNINILPEGLISYALTKKSERTKNLNCQFLRISFEF